MQGSGALSQAGRETEPQRPVFLRKLGRVQVAFRPYLPLARNNFLLSVGEGHAGMGRWCQLEVVGPETVRCAKQGCVTLLIPSLGLGLTLVLVPLLHGSFSGLSSTKSLMPRL